MRKPFEQRFFQSLIEGLVVIIKFYTNILVQPTNNLKMKRHIFAYRAQKYLQELFWGSYQQIFGRHKIDAHVFHVIKMNIGSVEFVNQLLSLIYFIYVYNQIRCWVALDFVICCRLQELIWHEYLLRLFLDVIWGQQFFIIHKWTLTFQAIYHLYSQFDVRFLKVYVFAYLLFLTSPKDTFQMRHKNFWVGSKEINDHVKHNLFLTYNGIDLTKQTFLKSNLVLHKLRSHLLHLYRQSVFSDSIYDQMLISLDHVLKCWF